MEEKILTAVKMLEALKALDECLPRPLTLVIGGGGAMLLAHGFPLATADIDAVPKGLSSEELGPLINKVAIEHGLPGDWLNPWYSSFTYVLPIDFNSRLIEVFRGTHLVAKALGKEDLLLMKCFAHRKKDIPHARALVRSGADVDFVYNRIDELAEKKAADTDAAQNFLNEILELEDV